MSRLVGGYPAAVETHGASGRVRHPSRTARLTRTQDFRRRGHPKDCPVLGDSGVSLCAVGGFLDPFEADVQPELVVERLVVK